MSNNNDGVLHHVEIDGQSQEIALLVPELEGELAIVYVSTIKKMASMLPGVPFSTIKDDFVQDIMNTNDLEDMMFAIEQELKFHKSVRIINNYQEEENNLATVGSPDM